LLRLLCSEGDAASYVSTAGPRFSTLVQKHFVNIAPAPIFAGLEGFDDGVLGLVKMFGGVFVLRGIATTDMAADEAFPKMDPGVAHFEAFLAALPTRLHLPDFT
jgi:hypothetical protein